MLRFQHSAGRRIAGQVNLARQGKCVAVFQDDVPLELTGKPAVSDYVPKLRIVK